MISANRKSAIKRKAGVLRVSRRTIDRYLARVGEAQGLEEIRREIALLGDDELLLFGEVAKILRSSYSSVYRWCTEEGKIPYLRLFRKTLRIRTSDLKLAFQQFEYFAVDGLEEV